MSPLQTLGPAACAQRVGAVRVHGTHAGPGKPDMPPPWRGGPRGQARHSAGHLRGLCLSGGPGDLVCIIRQPSGPTSRIAGRTTQLYL